MKNLKSRLKFNPLHLGKRQNHLGNKKGVALIMAITTLMFMVYIASEISRDSLIEYVVNSQELNRVKTYYAARNGMQIALLRIKLFQQASRLSLPPQFQSQLNQIWQFPFAWPIVPTGEVNAVDKENIQKLMTESLMDASYFHTIDDEGTKIDINDLVSPSKTLQQITKTQILNIFTQKMENDEAFREAYQGFQFEELIGRITDFMSDSATAVQGGDKRSSFSELGQEYPPNRGFRTLEEMRLVPGMNEELFNLLSAQLTIYGSKAINPNTATKEVIKSLDPAITEELAADVIKRRNDPDLGGPFAGEGAKCMENFKSYLTNGSQVATNRLGEEFDKIPFICDKVANFRIISTGIYGTGKNAIKRNITAVVMDLSRSANQVKTFLEEEKKKENPDPQNQGQNQQNPGQNPQAGNNPSGSGSKSSGQNQEPLPKGPPRIVYWTEN